MVLTAGSGCASLVGKPMPLYAGPERSDDQIATLTGQLEKIDSVDVSKRGTLFTLLPGCHVVHLKTSYSAGTANGSWSATIPKQVYALRMQAGRTYEIEVRRVPGASGLGIVTSVGNNISGGSLQVTATERDKDRTPLKTLSPIKGEDDIAACKEWEAQESSPAEPNPSSGGGDSVEVSN